MKNLDKKLTLIIIYLSFLGCQNLQSQHTEVSIKGESFYINDEITLKDVLYKDISMEGLLPNSRMVQGIFDDLNPETRHLWKYPDTGKWDADRNTDEFVAAIPSWKDHGLLAFSLNLQGGSPQGYSKEQPWINSPFTATGELRPDYFSRLQKILSKADELEMVVILGIFYFGQDERLNDEKAVIRAVENTINWLHQHHYKNILIEISNECDHPKYDHEILRPKRAHELIELVQNMEHKGFSYPASTSYKGNTIPDAHVVKASDFILLHGNAVNEPERITEMVAITKQMEGYTPKPIVFNEDDHYEFDQPENNMINAFRAGASWGYFDFRHFKGHRGSTVNEPFEDGFQSVPVDWEISSDRKKAFFEKIREISGINN